MRSKYSGSQRRFSKSPQQPPSSSSLRPFPQLNLEEANSDEDDANLTEKSGRSDDDVGNSGDWMEVDACLSCNKRGKSKLLVCCVIGCPVSIHEKCSNFKLAFDDLGRFCCPYCSYKREVSRAKELFQKAMLAKKALLGFIDSEMVGGEASGGDEKRDGGERVEFDGAENRDTPVEDGGDGLRVSYCDRCEVMVDDEMDGALPGAVDGSDNGHNSQEEKTQGIESLEDSISNEIRDGRNISETHEFENLEGEEGAREREENDNILKGGEGAESSRTHYVEKEQEHLQQDGCNDKEQEQIQQDGCDDKEQGQCVGEEQVHRDAREANSGGGVTAPKVPHFSDSGTGKSVVRRVKRLGKKKTALSQDAKLPEEEPPQPHAIDKQEAKPPKKKVSLSKEPRRRLESPKISSNLYPRNEKRQRLNWTAVEEDTLKEGVEKFAKPGNNNTPWRKILEFGHSVFDSTRTPTDLKDKWRNMTK
ncbi:protein CHROMATIN REMODELING [Salix suchowensis]|nr:protein CHROMATIN REMODELING [Salix suchowensis]